METNRSVEFAGHIVADEYSVPPVVHPETRHPRTPIARVPVELLARIIAFTVDIAAYETPKGQWLFQAELDYHSRHHACLCLAQVCTRWRCVVFTSPRLWTTVYVTNPQATTAALSRVQLQQYPLDVCAVLGVAEEPALRVALNSFTRFQRLYLYVWGMPFPRELVPPAAPLLKSLSLAGGSPTWFEECDMPLLEHLYLCCWDVRWGGALFKPTLTRLTLQVNAGELFPRSTMAQVVGVLATMPLLESLELHYMLGYSSEAQASAHVPQPTDLSHLKDLHLEDNAHSCAHLLQNLLFPTTTRMLFDCDLFDGVPFLCSIIVDKLFGRTSTGPRQILRAASVEHQSSEGRLERTILKFWPTLHSLDALRPQADLDLEDFDIEEGVMDTHRHLPEPLLQLVIGRDVLNPDLYSAPRKATSLLIRLFTGLRALLRTVQHLHLGDPFERSRPSSQMWTQCFGDMDDLRQLSVSRLAEGTLAEVLDTKIASQKAGHDGSPGTTLFLPKLEMLLFDGTDFANSELHESYLLTRYCYAFGRRMQWGAALHRVVFRYCSNIDQADTDRLQLPRLVHDVQWVEGDSDDHEGSVDIDDSEGD